MRQPQLWKKINNFQLDDPNSNFTFTQRLARDNKWSLEFSKKVVNEYKKFIYLCCCNYGQITPSDEVDQAWHQHLTYTKSYWIDFCKNTLNREIHHNPTKGGQSEDKKYSNCYDHTFEVYEIEFDSKPPSTIWPNNKKRFSEIDFKRINLSQYWLIDKSRTKFQLSLTAATIILVTFFIQSKESFPWLGMIVGVICLLFILRGFISGFRSKRSKRPRHRHTSSDPGADAASTGFLAGLWGSFWHNDSNDSGCSSSGCGTGGSSGCGGGGCGGGCSS